MHEDVIEAGKPVEYKQGYEDGQKRAWDLLGEAADWYRAQILMEERANKRTDLCYVARLETVLYTQQIIKKDSI